MPDKHDIDEASTGMDRRSAIKKGLVGAGAAGVIWAAPKIESLTLRPDYASAQTGGVAETFSIDFEYSNLIGSPGNVNWLFGAPGPITDSTGTTNLVASGGTIFQLNGEPSFEAVAPFRVLYTVTAPAGVTITGGSGSYTGVPAGPMTVTDLGGGVWQFAAPDLSAVAGGIRSGTINVMGTVP